MAGTIEINGTGGIIEGNLGAANVNVNLDPIYGNFNGSTSSVNAGSPTMFDDIFNGAGTIMAWIYPKSVGETAGRIFDKDKWALTMSDVANVLEFSVVHSTTTGVWKTGAVVPFNVWTHVAVVYDGSSTSNDPIIYLNGVATTITETATPAGTRTSDASDDLIIGNRADGARTFDGYMMDAKIYKAAGLSSTQIPIAAAKINQEPTLISTASPKGWYKFNASTTADSSGNSNTASASNMGSEVYDEFHVDVYDNSTTTDGTFTVTQGKVECLALSSLDLDGTNEYVDFGAVERGTADTTVSMWINPDALNDRRMIGDDGGSGDDHIRFRDNNGSIQVKIDGNEARFLASSMLTSPFAINKWQHLTVTHDYSTGDVILYRDGVKASATGNVTTNEPLTLNLIGGNNDGEYFDGAMRDVKIFDYILSDEQVASLYSGTYPQTPLHHWKLDEGHTTEATVDASGAFADSGTGTAANGTGANLDADSCVNGTLDLDGSLTIAANGTLSAPRGNLDVGGNMASNGALTHNNGKVRFTEHLQVTGTSLTFYNMSWDGSNIKTIDLMNDTTVENELDGNNQWRLKASSNTVTLTMGTATSQGTIDTTGMTNYGLEWDSNTSNFVKIKGVNSLFPAIITGTNIDWDDVSSGLVRLENCDFQGDITTGGGGVTITLTGDCEFDNFTVSAGDKLDLNGQRAEFSGNLSNQSTGSGNGIDYDGMLYFTGSGRMDSDGASENLDLLTLVQQGTSTSDADLAGDNLIKTFFYNQPSVTQKNHRGAIQTIIGTGTATCGSGESPDYTNLIVATGGTLDGSSSTLTVAGDFTTSGGLIGTSALNLTGSEEVTGTDNLDEVATSNRVTVEAWFKATTDANFRGIFSRGTAFDTGNIYLYMDGDGKIRFSMYELSATVTSTTSGLADGKWHHAAATYDQTNLKLYIDGKLEVSAAYTNAINTQTNGFKIGDRSGQNWEGQIGRVSIWDAALTEAQIREMLFYDFATADSEATIPDANCIGWWQFDEGSGTAVADSSTNNADGTLNSAAWAGKGDFTYGTSTLVFAKSGTQTFNYKAAQDFNNITINAGSTLSLKGFGLGSGNALDCFGNLVVTGTLTDSGNSSIMKIKAADKTHDFSGTMTGLYQLLVDNSGSTNLPALNTPRLKLSSTSTAVATGNHTITQELEVNAGTTYNANGNTITTREADINGSGGTLDLRNSTLSLAYSSAALRFEDNSVLLSGNSIVTGLSSASKAFLRCPAAMGAELVGTLKFMNAEGGGTSTSTDITVIGAVIDCSFADSTANIRQFFHTLDTQQLLDADEAGDDDLRLTKPTLDNSHELQTG